MTLSQLKSTDFSVYLNQTFDIHLETGETLAIELVEVNELSQVRAGLEESSKHRAFSIVFKSAEDIVIPQKIYQLKHEKMGTLDLFLVQIAPNKYEAVFT